MRFAQSIFENEEMLNHMIEIQRAGKKALIADLEKYGYRYHPGEGNFIFIQPKTDATTLMNRMKAEKKILIKTYPNVGELGDCLRVTTGEEQYMKQFIEALLELDR